jgi:hypothetical protein
MRVASSALCNAATAFGVGRIDILLGQSKAALSKALPLMMVLLDAATFCYLSGRGVIT